MRFIVLLAFFCSLQAIGSGQLFTVDPTKIIYRLCTSTSGVAGQIITSTTIPTGVIDTTKPLKILIHGWLSNATTPFMQQTTEAYFARGITNVLQVDWGFYASQLLGYTYALPAAQSQQVGEAVGDMLIEIWTQTGMAFPWANVHLIGHSLGAQVSAFTGQHIQKMFTGTSVGRITGLDPAGPGYVLAPEIFRLSSNDALFVDNIHTSALAGYNPVIGVADFYVNGGVIQPGCLLSCGHNRALEVFTESVWAYPATNTNQFVGKKCQGSTSLCLGYSCANGQNVMGEDVDQTKPGVYYVETNTASTFAQGNVC